MSKSSGGNIYREFIEEEFGVSSGLVHVFREQDFESTDVHALKDKVCWEDWLAKSLWTPEQGFALIKSYDPDEFEKMKKIPSRNQSDLYPFGEVEAQKLQECFHHAVMRDELELFHLKEKSALSVGELFRDACVDPLKFIEWAINLIWFRFLAQPLPAPLEEFRAMGKVQDITEKSPSSKDKADDLIMQVTAIVAELRKDGLSNKKIVERMGYNIWGKLTNKQLGKALLRPGESDKPETNEKRGSRAKGGT